MQSCLIPKNITIDTILNNLRQRPSITCNDRFAVFHRLDGDEAEGFPAAGHDDGVAGGVVAREFFVWYPAEEGDAVGVFLFDLRAAADDVVADDGEVEVVALAGVEGLQEDIQAFLGIKSAYKQEVSFPQGQFDGRVDGAFFRGDAAVDDGLVIFLQAIAEGGLVLVARYVDDGVRPRLQDSLYGRVDAAFPLGGVAQEGPAVGVVDDAAGLALEEQGEPDKEAGPGAVAVDDVRLDGPDGLADGMDGMRDLRQAPMVVVVVDVIRWQLPARLAVLVRADQEVLDVRVLRVVEEGADVGGDAALDVFADVQYSHHAHRLSAVYPLSLGIRCG